MKRFLLILVLVLSSTFISAQDSFALKLSEAAIELTKQKVFYDPSYFKITYPNGDVPSDRGVCTDVIIRAYRKLGIDLQKEMHEDIKGNFGRYPRHWGLTKPDKNIDHRRVPNMMVFFRRNGTELVISNSAKDYAAGDIVCWNLGGGITHIAVVVNKKSAEGDRNLVAHNIGAGQVLEDCLFKFKIIGHFRYNK